MADILEQLRSARYARKHASPGRWHRTINTFGIGTVNGEVASFEHGISPSRDASFIVEASDLDFDAIIEEITKLRGSK